MRSFAPRAGLSTVFAMAGALSAPAGEGARITINDLDFTPATVTVHVGDRVEWLNKDIVEHTATARDGAFDIATPKGRPASARMKAVGRVEYYCRLHPNMVGVINVVK